jgi:hypothetical protein
VIRRQPGRADARAVGCAPYAGVHGDGTYTIRVVTPNADVADYVSKEGAIASRPQLTVTLG